MSKFICSACGYTHEGNEAPKRCPICKSPSSQFTIQDDAEKDEVKSIEQTADVTDNLDDGEAIQEKVNNQDSDIDISEDAISEVNIQKDDCCSEKDKNEIKKFDASTKASIPAKKRFSSIQKFFLGVLVVLLPVIIIGSLSDGWLLSAFVSSCFLAAIIYLMLGKIDRKYTWITIIAAFVIPFSTVGFSADKQDNKKSEIEVSNKKESEEEGQKTDTELKSETKNVENKTKETDKLSLKEQEIADAGYKKGAMAGYAATENEEFSNMLDLADQIEGMEDKVNEMIEQMASQQYELEFNAPSNIEEEKLKKLYIEYFKKGMDDTMDAMDGTRK